MSASQGVGQSHVVKLRFTLLRASNLPESRAGLSTYFATLETSAGSSDRSDRRTGKNPKWNKEFLCEVNATSPTLSINVFRIGLARKTELVAIAFPGVATCLHPSSTDILDKPCPLLSPTDHTPLGTATIFYSCTPHHEGRPAVELTASTLQILVQGEDAIPIMTTPGDSGLTTALSFASSDITQSIIDILGKIDRVGQIITEVHPYAKLAWTVLNTAQRSMADQIDRDDRIRSLWETVKTTLDLVDPLGKLKDMPLYKKTVEAILKQTYECVLFLRWYAGKGFGGRLARDTLSDKASTAIEIFEKAFQHLLKSLQDGFSVDHIKQTYRVVAATETIAEIAVDEHLDRLPGATLSWVEYDKHKACLSGTRKELLNGIEEWVHTPGDGAERILWLSGPAGTGKSSVANSIAERMDSLGRLAASFRFDRGQADRTPAVLIGNLCRQVARFDNSLEGAILEAVKRHGPGGSMPCASQAAKLFVGPISKIEIVGPIVIVIDALDESGNDEAVQGGASRKDLVRAIVEEFIHLPPSIKLIITSREEGCITTLMSSSQLCKHLSIIETSDVETDIKTFIENEIHRIRDWKKRRSNWPGRDKVEALVQYANGLFICAAVACSFIEKGDPDLRMKEILHPSSPPQLTALDGLYMTVVEQSLKSIQSDRGDKLAVNNWKRVVGTISALRTPLTVVEMDALLGLPTDLLHTTRDFIDSLLPLLKMNAEKCVQLLHKSVFDFLTTRTIDVPVWHAIDLPVWHQKLAVDCLTYMNNNLKYEMSWIYPTESTSPPELCNVSALVYACRHFAKHLSEPGFNLAPCTNQLRIFLTEHLLHWFEVMARLREVYKAEESLKLLLVCLMIPSTEQDGHRENDEVDELSDIIWDGISFLQNFRSVCTLSPMDIYHSGIAMSPTESWIYKLYSGCVPLPRVTSSSLLWSRSLSVFEGHQEAVTSVAFSRDGKIASGSEDKTVRLWDSEKGEAIGSALEGHRSEVTLVVFSPDGKKVASGSYDSTVRLWDAEKGEAIGSALEGHLSSVISVVFSPDGKKIASGSDDWTVRLWDVEKGEAIGAALEGHRSGIMSIVFSPDGKEVASGSDDGTVRLWDVEKGEAIESTLEGQLTWVTSLVFSPDGKKVAWGSLLGSIQLWEQGYTIGSTFEGHFSSVRSIAFSPDGKKVGSGSDDGTIWLRDAENGEAIGAALEGHRSGIMSIVFSPDGKKVASGSDDGTVRLWDVEKGEAIGSALEGHRSGVTSIVFSPDGKKVASGSKDRTVRLWDVEMGDVIGSTLEANLSGITSIIFSPDGKKVASGSKDKTARLWDVENGEANKPAFKRHRDMVMSIVFSPDGKKVASGSKDTTVRLWDAEKGESVGPALEGHRSGVTSIVFSPDGKKVASGSDDSTIRLWDVEKGEEIGSALEGHRSGVTSIVFSPDGKMVASGSDDRIVRLWDTEKGEAIAFALVREHSSIKFSESKNRWLWDDEERWSIPECHRGWVTSIVFSPDGKTIDCRSPEGNAHVEKVFSVDVHTNRHYTIASKHGQSNGLVSIDRMTNISTKTPVSLLGLKLDVTGFLINGEGHRLVWIPAHLRGRTIAVHTRTVAIGGANGAITIISFPL